jgi:hypothetical protein
MKFTEGPWHVSADGCDVENAEGAGVCTMYADETAEANAALIASAPILYKSLRFLVDAAETEPGMDVYKAHLAQAEAALTLAKGGE